MSYILISLAVSLFVFKSIISSIFIGFVFAKTNLKSTHSLTLMLIASILIYSIHYQMKLLTFQQTGLYIILHFGLSIISFGLLKLFGNNLFIFISSFPLGIFLKRGAGISSALILSILITFLNVERTTLIKIILTILPVALYSVRISIDALGETDPKNVVIDELIGVSIAIIIAPTTGNYHTLLAWFMFAFFDVLKVFPVNILESITCEWGVVLDDIGAGVMAGVLLWIFTKYFPLLV